MPTSARIQRRRRVTTAEEVRGDWNDHNLAHSFGGVINFSVQYVFGPRHPVLPATHVNPAALSAFLHQRPWDFSHPQHQRAPGETVPNFLSILARASGLKSFSPIEVQRRRCSRILGTHTHIGSLAVIYGLMSLY